MKESEMNPKPPKKPMKPMKPFAPSPQLTHRPYRINIMNLLADDRNPSIQELINLLPPGINLSEVSLALSIGKAPLSNYSAPLLHGAGLTWSIPINYKDEYDKYTKAMERYHLEMIAYEKEMSFYKVDFENYKKLKEQEAKAKRRAQLEAELKALDGE